MNYKGESLKKRITKKLLSVYFFEAPCFAQDNRQLLNEVEHDIENYQARGLRYPPKPKAEVDNTNRGLDNSRYYAKTEFNNCFSMYSQPKNKEQYKRNTRKFHAKLIRTTFF